MIDIDLENMFEVNYFVCVFYNDVKYIFVMYDVIVVGVILLLVNDIVIDNVVLSINKGIYILNNL